MRRGLIWSAAGLAAVAAAGLFVTRAVPDETDGLAALTGDVANGEVVFIASGCASCHAADDAEGDAKRVLTGGHRLASDFGTFVAPNISMDATHGIGDWTLDDFATALRAGVSPDGQHYYPAFPYASYAGMTDQDVVDLWAFMQTLPADATPSAPHDIGFPFNIRRAVGVWKTLYLNDDWVVTDVPSPELERGRYLVEVLAHCGECHTPRDALGGLDRAAWMAGAPNPSGRGTIPALTPDELTWSAADVAYYLETGFTPDFDSAGGSMADVVTNFAQLSASDRQAVAAYIKALPR
ncbi:c-type cytochrome [Marivita hallyeonensis]|uniref:Cytochrome c, mono-and diheme variants n=1 Tax=Marivita hallyeonensis TaxID=996342 RepID=A0A1M5R716_9RHOB|nr:cytochrome c [Marivita hallyeonensis]SHH21643.1 Cytochrome c, mono-and diheme variants [Marivita hallyeonensis]